MVKEIQVIKYITDDGIEFDNIEEATEHEQMQELYTALNAKENMSHYAFDDIWNNRDKLVEFFIKWGYVSRIQ